TPLVVAVRGAHDGHAPGREELVNDGRIILHGRCLELSPRSLGKASSTAISAASSSSKAAFKNGLTAYFLFKRGLGSSIRPRPIKHAARNRGEPVLSSFFQLASN